MYLNKSSKGIGWYSYIKKNQRSENVENAPTLNFVFKKDTEPEANTIEGDLFFIDRMGNKRMVFPYVNDWNGNRRIEFRIMGCEKQVQSPLPFYGEEETEPVQDVEIESSDLPFY